MGDLACVVTVRARLVVVSPAGSAQSGAGNRLDPVDAAVCSDDPNVTAR